MIPERVIKLKNGMKDAQSRLSVVEGQIEQQMGQGSRMPWMNRDCNSSASNSTNFGIDKETEDEEWSSCSEDRVQRAVKQKRRPVNSRYPSLRRATTSNFAPSSYSSVPTAPPVLGTKDAPSPEIVNGSKNGFSADGGTVTVSNSVINVEYRITNNYHYHTHHHRFSRKRR